MKSDGESNCNTIFAHRQHVSQKGGFSAGCKFAESQSGRIRSRSKDANLPSTTLLLLANLGGFEVI
jgi:hypothetical protein